MSPREIIDRLGGYRTVAEACGKRANTAVKWCERGIPARMWPTVMRIAKQKRLRGITLETLEAQRTGRR
jgi:hypothetical protein